MYSLNSHYVLTYLCVLQGVEECSFNELPMLVQPAGRGVLRIMDM